MSISTLLLVTPLALSHAQPIHASKDIVDTAVEAGSFQLLTAALKAADLTHALRASGPFTVLAPSDDAFRRLPEATLTYLLSPEGKHDLVSILQYHVVPGDLDAQHVSRSRSLTTLLGQEIDVRVGDGGLRIDGASVLSADIVCSNGRIHVIDSVLTPTTRDLVETAQAAGTFQTLLEACKAADLVSALRGKENLTVLAPTDDAFARLSRGTLQALLAPANRQALAQVLTYHVIPGRRLADGLLSEGRVRSLAGEELSFALREGRLQVGAAAFVANDVEASNGIVHAIDSVLLPPNFTLPGTRLVVGFYSERPSKALASQLGIDRGKSLLVTSVTSGSNADRFGLERYDVIISMNGRSASESILDTIKGEVGFGGIVSLTVLRQGKSLTLEVPVGLEKH